MKNPLKKINRTIVLTLLCMAFTLPAQRTEAAVPLAILEIIKAGVKKVIVAMDLKIQRQQNKVIWLQNAQKVLENTMSKLKLDEISNWNEKQRALYEQYFDELQQVKSAISSFQRVRDITQKQTLIVSEYKKVWAAIKQDTHFTAAEKEYMAKVYSGLLATTVDNLDQLTLLVKSFTLQMSDGERLTLLNETANRVDQNYRDLQSFNRSNGQLSLQRAKSSNEISIIQNLYGLNR
ncbi:conjugal transfer protein TraI [Algoriphagus sp. D3-2-R+10]|uniref:conjugal transfer protein TraI n=1 Tax=Algoriphagus aurantiacus TaxID=3103948 RepID=UPI002B39614A|nr:conjugal transfer protein TraI [Algoriphagus sp. D3-2-R+10]MEB2774642.1 conjugal transfer protein TraI [Algoriphagus sp. D3-2-R+10]